jgi:hypothetical protein
MTYPDSFLDVNQYLATCIALRYELLLGASRHLFDSRVNLPESVTTNCRLNPKIAQDIGVRQENGHTSKGRDNID